MKAVLIAATEVNPLALEALGFTTDPGPEPVDMYGGEGFGDWDADALAEFAGRNCYQSFDRPNPATAANEDYLGINIIGKQHESVFEHGSATFYIETSRSVLTELERHRHLSFSVVSQRYVDATELGYQLPPAVDELKGPLFWEAREALTDFYDEAEFRYEQLVRIFTDAGKPRKQAREAARAVLPNMTNSPMVVSGNHRAWRYVIKQRWHEAADAEIRELAGELLRQLREIAPNTYQDIPDEPYSY